MCTVIRVIDGDTIVIAAPWVPAPLKPQISVRVCGINCPELREEHGQDARRFTEQFIAGKQVDVEFVRWDKYGGRIVGHVRVEKKSLADELLAAGLAVPFTGKTG